MFYTNSFGKAKVDVILIKLILYFNEIWKWLNDLFNSILQERNLKIEPFRLLKICETNEPNF